MGFITDLVVGVARDTRFRILLHWYNFRILHRVTTMENICMPYSWVKVSILYFLWKG